MGDAAVPNPLLADVKSPKSVALPKLLNVIKSISFFCTGAYLPPAHTPLTLLARPEAAALATVKSPSQLHYFLFQKQCNL